MSSVLSSVGNKLSNMGLDSSQLVAAAAFSTLNPAALLVCNNFPWPLYHVELVEVSSSHDVQKQRSIGQVFFAHQEGAKLIITIRGLLVGPLKHMHLSVLEMVHLLGSSETKEYMTNPSGTAALSSDGYRRVIQSLKETATLTGNAEESYYQLQDLKGWEAVYKQKTFAVVIEDGHYDGLFMKTFNYNRNAKLHGLDAIQYTAVFEKVLPPPENLSIWDKQASDAARRTEIRQLERKKLEFKAEYNAAASPRKVVLSRGVNGYSWLIRLNELYKQEAIARDLTTYNKIKWVGTPLQDFQVSIVTVGDVTEEVKAEAKKWVDDGTDHPYLNLKEYKKKMAAFSKADFKKNVVWRVMRSAANIVSSSLSNVQKKADWFTEPLVDRYVRANNPLLPSRGGIIASMQFDNLKSTKTDVSVELVTTTLDLTGTSYVSVNSPLTCKCETPSINAYSHELVAGERLVVTPDSGSGTIYVEIEGSSMYVTVNSRKRLVLAGGKYFVDIKKTSGTDRIFISFSDSVGESAIEEVDLKMWVGEV